MDAPVPPEAAAEDLDVYVRRPSSAVVEVRDSVVLIDTGDPSPLFRLAARIRFAADPDPEINSVRDWFASRGHASFTWKLGASSTPSGLEAKLRALGAHEDEAEPEHTAMVLDREPPRGEVDVRSVETYEDYVASAEILAVGFGGSFTEAERQAQRSMLPERYKAYREDGFGRRYLALIDGRPVAVGTAVQTSAGVVALGGGATLPEARGRGAYRALVRARWDDAVAAGSPVLVTQASGMSRPILEALGFRAVGRVLELIDATAA